MSETLARAIVVLGGDATELDKVMSAAEQRVHRAGERMSEIGAALATRVTLPLVAAGGVALKAFRDQQDALARLDGVIQATGGASRITADRVKELARQLEGVTRFADDVTEEAAALLLTFTQVQNRMGEGNDIFDRTIKLAQDMTALFGGDLKDNVRAFGRALEDPVQGLLLLRRANISFTEAENQTIKKLHESGKVLEAQRMMLDKLAARFGGLAVKMGQATPGGELSSAWNQLNNSMEDVGEVLNKVVSPALRMATKLLKDFQELSAGFKVAFVVIASSIAVIGPAIMAVGEFVKAIGILKGGAAVLGIAFAKLALILGLVTAALASLVAAAISVVKNWTWVKLQLASVWALIKDLFFRGVDFVLGQIELFLKGMGELVGLIGKLPGAQKFGEWLSSPWEAGAAAVAGFRQRTALAAEESLAASGRVIAALEAEMDAALAAAKAPTRTRPGGGTQSGNVVNPAPWAKAGEEALTAMSKALADAAKKEALLGDRFDLTSAKADIYERALTALIEAGVPLNEITDKYSRALGEAGQKYLFLARAMEDQKAQQEALNDLFSQAAAAVEAAMTPTQIYEQTIKALNAAVDRGKIGWAAYDAAVKKAQETLDEATQKTSEFKQAMTDLVKDSVSGFVDAIFDAKTNWHDFAHTLLRDIAKLIIKMAILNALFPKGKDGKGSGFLGGILGFAAGGFLPPGQLGIVGEKGPELVMAGNAGMTITPLPAASVSAPAVGGGGIPLVVNLNVSAIDQRGVARFFEENEGHVAGALLRAHQRSDALRRHLGG